MGEFPAIGSNADLADYVKVPVKTIEKWRHEGTGPKGFRVGRHVRYRREDVEKWLADRAAA